MAGRSADTKKKSSIWMLIISVLCLGIIIACAVIIFTDKSDIVLDPFEYTEMRFEGDSGSGRAVFTVREAAEDEKIPFTAADFTINQTEGLKEGDTVSVKIDTEPEGYKYTAKVRNFTVSGLNTCIADGSELSDSVVGTLRETADPVIEKHGSDPENAELIHYDVADVVLVYVNESENRIYVIYDAVFRNDRGAEEETVMAVRLDNVILRRDTGEAVPGRALIFGEWLNVVGGTGKEVTFGFVPGFADVYDAKDAIREEAPEDAVITELYHPAVG